MDLQQYKRNIFLFCAIGVALYYFAIFFAPSISEDKIIMGAMGILLILFGHPLYNNSNDVFTKIQNEKQYQDFYKNIKGTFSIFFTNPKYIKWLGATLMISGIILLLGGIFN